jgi:hypothetical protein
MKNPPMKRNKFETQVRVAEGVRREKDEKGWGEDQEGRRKIM